MVGKEIRKREKENKGKKGEKVEGREKLEGREERKVGGKRGEKSWREERKGENRVNKGIYHLAGNEQQEINL